MIQEKKLANRDFLDDIRELADAIIGQDDFRSAKDLSKELIDSINSVKNFRKDNGDLYREYNDIIVKLRWVGLNTLADDEVVQMFKDGLVKVFEMPDFNIWAKLKTILLSITFVDPRDKYKKQLIQALLGNQERITSKNLIINNERVEPTVSNWLLDYNKTLGTGRVKGLARTDYLVNSSNIRSLNNIERQKIKTLFGLYEKLKLSSKTFEGLEDDIPIDDPGKEGVIRNGVFEQFKETEKQKRNRQIIDNFFKGQGGGVNLDIEELRSLMNNYPAGSFERKTIEEEIKKLKQ